MTIEDIVTEAQQLSIAERMLLIERLQATLVTEGVTRAELLAAFEQRKATGRFKNVESLYGKYAGRADVSQKELDALFHEIGTEWEHELDEFNLLKMH